MPGKSGTITNRITYPMIDDLEIMDLIRSVRKGLAYKAFVKIAERIPFELQEWSYFLNLSDRTLQRYKAEGKVFDQPRSERILQIALLIDRGNKIFGDGQKFYHWLEAKNVALGGIQPKTLLDSTFGIDLLMDELTRIEHGVLA